MPRRLRVNVTRGLIVDSAGCGPMGTEPLERLGPEGDSAGEEAVETPQ